VYFGREKTEKGVGAGGKRVHKERKPYEAKKSISLAKNRKGTLQKLKKCKNEGAIQ